MDGRFFEFLIDSGADYTIIPRSDALIIGLEYPKISGKEIKIQTANLSYMHAKEVKLYMTFRDYIFTIPVLIAKEEVDRLLGRKGFFNKFEITFNEHASVVKLKKISHA